MTVERDPGVPGALAEAVRRLVVRTGPERLDRLWLFPPLRQGRRERGVLAAGCFSEGDRRLLVTLAYRAEETGRGITFRTEYHEEGEAPKDRLPKVMEGVVRRSGDEPGEPRLVVLDGASATVEELLRDLAPSDEDVGEGDPRRTFGSAEEAST